MENPGPGGAAAVVAEGGHQRGTKRPRIRQKYLWDDKKDIIGEGTYGLVYKATHNATKKRVAIKKFKNTKEGEGISITACREIMVCQRPLGLSFDTNLAGLLCVCVGGGLCSATVASRATESKHRGAGRHISESTGQVSLHGL